MIQYGIIGEKLSVESDAVAAPPPERTEYDKIHRCISVLRGHAGFRRAACSGCFTAFAYNSVVTSIP